MKTNPTKDDLLGYVDQNRDAIKFIILFLTFCTAFYLLYYRFIDRFVFLNDTTASLLGFSLRILGRDVLVNGSNVVVDGFALTIIDECTAIFGSIVYVSCVLAYPADVTKKGIGIAFGIPCLYVINMIRLVILAFVGMFMSPEIFDFVHTYLWQTIFIVFVIFIWLVWVDRVVK